MTTALPAKLPTPVVRRPGSRSASVASTSPVAVEAPAKEAVAPPETPAPRAADERARALSNRGREAIVDAIARELAASRAADRSGLRVATDVHEASGRFIVRIVEEDTGEVVREYPQEDYLDVVAILEQLDGLLLEETI